MQARHIVIPLLAAAALGTGGWFAWRWWHDGRFQVSTDNAYVEADAAVMAPKIAGYVREVRVADNQLVHAGETLAVIDDVAFRARSASAHAAAAAAAARTRSLETQKALQRALIEAAAAGVESAAAELRRAQSEFDRSQTLAKDRWASRERLDEARSTIDKAQAALRAAEAALAAERERARVLDAQHEEAAALQAQAVAEAAIADEQLAATVITAPLDGVVGNKTVQVGQYVAAGSQMMVIVPLPDVHVVANFKETQIGGLRQGQPVTIHVDAWPDTVIEGRVDSLAPASGAMFSLLPPENATGNFTKIVQRIPVRIAVPRDNPLSGRLRPGLSVEVAIDTRDPGTGEPLVAGVFGAAVRAGSGTEATALR
jgi:membrane fusion protein (multidrug efflux system)